MRSILLSIILLCMAPMSWATSCTPVGAFTGAYSACCANLVKDANTRCQFPTCKKQGEAATVTSNDMTDCCWGLAPVAGKCQVPTLHRTCSIQGEAPRTDTPCCKGLVRDGSRGVCVRSSVMQCTVQQIPSCCYGATGNTCSCYCPTVYYKNT